VERRAITGTILRATSSALGPRGRPYLSSRRGGNNAARRSAGFPSHSPNPAGSQKKGECTRIRIRRHPSTTRSECGYLRLVSFPSGGKRIQGGWAWNRTAGEPAAPPAGDAEGLGHELLEKEGEGCQPRGGQPDLLGGAGGAPLNGEARGGPGGDDGCGAETGRVEGSVPSCQCSNVTIGTQEQCVADDKEATGCARDQPEIKEMNEMSRELDGKPSYCSVLVRGRVVFP